MKDRLEDFVKAHRDEFDSFTPRPDLWQDIAAELAGPPEASAPVEPVREAKVIQLNWNMALRYAAAVAVLLVVGFAARYYRPESGGAANPVASATPAPVPLEKIAPELRQIETQYVRVIEQKESQLQEYNLKELGMDQEWKQEAAALDSAYNQLKQELYTTPNKDVVIQAMSDNLKMRIAILNRQLQVLENIQTFKGQATHETTNI